MCLWQTFPTVGGGGTIKAVIMLRGKIAARNRNKIEAQQNSSMVKTKNKTTV